MTNLESSAVVARHPVVNPATGRQVGAGRSVTLFGGSGFVGRYLVPLLARDGWHVRVAVRHPAQADFLKTAGDIGQISPVFCDLARPETIKSVLVETDAVVNLVGILFEHGRQKFQTLQADGPAVLARAAQEAGVEHFVQVSAIGADHGSPAHYARSKGRGEQAVRAVYPAAPIVRPSVVFGREDDFFNRFARMAAFSPVLPMVGRGKTLFQPVFVGDVAEFLRRCVNDPRRVAGQTYELGGPDVWSFAQCLRYLLRVMNKKRPLVSLPFPLARVQAFFMEFFPTPPLTRDQVILLQQDNIVSADVPGLADLGLAPTPMVAVVPHYIGRGQNSHLGSLPPSL